MIKRTLPIINKLGLHARAATKLTAMANRYQCEIRTGKQPPLVNAKSIMHLMLLAASQGTNLLFEFDGPDEQQACDDITQLLANYFDEGQ